MSLLDRNLLTWHLSFCHAGESFEDVTGFNHCWCNIEKWHLEDIKKRDSFLVIAGDLIGDVHIEAFLDRAKILQQRFPDLCIIAFLKSHWDHNAIKANLADLVMKKFLTFPILLSDKSFVEMENGPCFILFQDGRGHEYLKPPLIYKEKDILLGILDKDIENLNIQKIQKIPDIGTVESAQIKRAWYKEIEIIREPLCCFPLQNLALYLPGCISADESGSRLFISDSNHHRILVVDEIGNIVDCIGSSPGFADGEFEYAKFLRPGATFYDDTSDCLYIADSENHAIRKADMEKRVLETVYPVTTDSKKTDGVWAWLMKKLQFKKEVDSGSKKFDYNAIFFPWHILRSDNDNAFVITTSFEKLWILDTASGDIKQHIIGYSQVVDACRDLMTDRMSLLNHIPSSWLTRQTKSDNFLGFFSSATPFDDGVVMCDNSTSQLLKVNPRSGELSHLKLSNFHKTGFPYWLSLPLERFYILAEAFQQQINRLEHFEILPGKVAIQVHVSLPEDTELVEPMQEELIWCQARGTATVFYGSMNKSELPEKINITQQWYNELDNLAFSTPESASSNQDSPDTFVDSDGKLLIKCFANTSPGTCEIFISAAFYLKLRGNWTTDVWAKRLVALLDSRGCSEMDREMCVQYLLKSVRDLTELVLVRPLHLRLKLECLDYPKADSVRDTKLTESTIVLHVSL